MLTYNQFEIDLRSVPGEICLTFYIADCPHRCKGCSSPWLWDKGKFELSSATLDRALQLYPYVSCVCFMGGDNDHDELIRLINTVHRFGRKAAVYSGDDYEHGRLMNQCDYYKIGSWDETKGPLNAPTTNQRMYKRVVDDGGCTNYVDITSKFWTDEVRWRPAMEKTING